MFVASPWLEIIDIQTSHFADFQQLKIDNHSVDFGQVKIDPTHLLLLNLGRSQLLYWFWVKR